MKYVLYYAPGEVDEKAPLYAEAHHDWYVKFAERGTLLMIGPFANPQQDAS